jgi:phage shock protein PspC (stress-responsive transcriptional regulator)
MKKVININLGGLPYIIDEDAFSHLTGYLDAIRNHFSYSEGCEEIMYDIELRLSELFQEQLKAKQIITMTELDAAIEVLGTPEEFGAESTGNFYEEPQNKTHNSSKTGYKYIKTGKRLYRNEDEKIIGGVCSGLAAYLGIDDPLWVRIAFLGGVFLGGFSILPYILMMIIVPKAKTAAEKLAMKGEPINIENIAKTVENEISEISQTLSNLGSKKKSLNDKENHSFQFAAIANNGFSLIGSTLSTIFHFFSKIFKGIFSVGFFGAIVFLTILVVCLVLLSLKIMPLTAFVSPLSASQTKIMLFATMALIIIPMIGLVLLIGRWFYPQKTKSNNYYLSLSWLASLVIVIVFATQIGQFFANYKTSSSLSTITDKVLNKNLSLAFNDIDYSNGTINFGDIVIQDAKKNLLQSGFINNIESIDVILLNKVIIEKTDEKDVTILEQIEHCQ